MCPNQTSRNPDTLTVTLTITNPGTYKTLDETITEAAPNNGACFFAPANYPSVTGKLASFSWLNGGSYTLQSTITNPPQPGNFDGRGCQYTFTDTCQFSYQYNGNTYTYNCKIEMSVLNIGEGSGIRIEGLQIDHITLLTVAGGTPGFAAEDSYGSFVTVSLTEGFTCNSGSFVMYTADFILRAFHRSRGPFGGLTDIGTLTVGGNITITP